LAQQIPALPGTGIVYVLTQRDAEQVAGWLRSNGIDAYAYHSDIQREGFEDSNAYRLHLEDRLLNNEIKVLVATIALGMGYDKPDLAFVIHYQAPGSVVGYYQQVGRAGRGLDRAYAVLLSGREDENIHEYFRRTAFPGEDEVDAILRALEESDGLTIRELEQRANLRYGQIDKALKYLSVEERAPVVKEGSRWKRTPVRYRLDHAQIERLTRQREIEWGEIQAYIATEDCLMGFLRHALDDPAAEPCGQCARCVGKEIVPSTFDRRLGVAATGFLRTSEMPLATKKRIPRGSLDAYGFGTTFSADLLPEEGRVLSRWGDAGWGSIVADGKHANRFGDDLVAAVVDMIRNRWQPQPAPQWVTCVPSRNRPDLVPGFAARLADALGLPFRAVVEKTRDNEPQKTQQNTFHRCQNLDGVFAIDEHIPPGPVLLVDDVFDSGWTLTIISALLLRAGSGAVFPLALAATSTSD
jgi:ATP-dependent DNA helicase RecQ